MQEISMIKFFLSGEFAGIKSGAKRADITAKFGRPQ